MLFFHSLLLFFTDPMISFTYLLDSLLLLQVLVWIHWLYPLQRDMTLSLKRNVLSMTLNCIEWWGSSSGGLGDMKYPFFTIIPRKHLLGVLSMGQVGHFRNWYSIKLCTKKNNYTKMWMYNQQDSLISWHKITLDKSTRHKKTITCNINELQRSYFKYQCFFSPFSL